jgi:FK506-binding nuclear protein
LSKSQKKKLKKQKQAVDDTTNVVTGSEKKVQFSPELEQGPTGVTATKPSEPPKPAISSQAKPDSQSLKKRKRIELANGIAIEDYKVGSGPKAKNGTKLGIRYIGKLDKNSQEFDKNTKGKPFRFTLGKGEVIKGKGYVFGTTLITRMGYWFGGYSTWRGAKNPCPCCHGIWIAEKS